MEIFLQRFFEIFCGLSANNVFNFKVDVIVNSEYFEKCIENSEFFRQITLAAICEKIKVCRNSFL